MARCSALFAPRSEAPLPGDMSGPHPEDQELSAHIAARQNSPIRSKTKHNYCSPKRKGMLASMNDILTYFLPAPFWALSVSATLA